ncbi:MAG TPA: efflux RND transporter periplasmic adaptor subunit [Stellaceae bacterium]|nr:efflux RND transporter periplasmic adaptor subunit [Stellaceae bacterium]
MDGDIGTQSEQRTFVSSPRSAPAVRRHLLHGRRLWLITALILVLATGGAAWWWIASRSAAMHYTSAPVTRGAVIRTVTATGTINPVLTIIVGSYVSGVIQSLQCDYNTKVTKGQVCAKIDPRPFQAIVDQYSANLAVAKAQLAKDQANLEYTKANSARTALLARENSIAQDAADQSLAAYHQGQAQVLLDQASIQQWQAQLEGAQVNLAYTDIVSPVDGTVVSRNVTQGQTVAASLQTPTLFLIATDLTQMEVDTNVSESDIGTVKEKDPTTFTVEAYPDRTFTGAVVQVRQAPQTLQNVVTFDVVIDVANLDLALMPGMTATTRITTAQRDNVIRVPDQALRYTPANAPAAPATVAPFPAQMAAPTTRTGEVWVLSGGNPVRVAVTLGLDDDTYTEIIGGDLKAGDEVIVSEQRGGGNAKSAIPLPHL